MRRLNHLTPQYITSRLAAILDEKLNPENPWLTKDAVKLLIQLLRESDVGVEFGSGRSTKWFLGKLAKLTSVEANSEWFKLVLSNNRQDIDEGRLDYRLSSEEDEYIAIIKEFSDDSLDFALVDGEHRDICALNILPKLKRGSILVVDNINWFIPCDSSRSPDSRKIDDGGKTERWDEFMRKVGGYRYIWTSNGVTDTGIWIKCT